MCCICLESYESPESHEVSRTHCGHAFHARCVDAYACALAAARVPSAVVPCPVCRAPLASIVVVGGAAGVEVAPPGPDPGPGPGPRNPRADLLCMTAAKLCVGVFAGAMIVLLLHLSQL